MSQLSTPALPKLLVLTDRFQLPGDRDLVATLRAIAELAPIRAELALVTGELAVVSSELAVVLRELDLPWPERERLAAELADFIPVIAAREVLRAAVGTHLSAVQPAPRGSRFAGPSAMAELGWGRSCHSVDDVRRAVDEGASWVTLGPVAETPSKPGYQPVLTDSEIADAAAIAPVFALGGVTPDNAKTLLGLGIHGLAVMGTVMRADDPAAVVAALLEAA